MPPYSDRFDMRIKDNLPDPFSLGKAEYPELIRPSSMQEMCGSHLGRMCVGAVHSDTLFEGVCSS